jgi:hypothetical protein
MWRESPFSLERERGDESPPLFESGNIQKHHADCPANKSSIGAPEYNSFKNPQQ